MNEIDILSGFFTIALLFIMFMKIKCLFNQNDYLTNQKQNQYLQHNIEQLTDKGNQ